jgi:hypothetical protein
VLRRSNGEYVLAESVLRAEDSTVTVDVRLQTTGFLEDLRRSTEW